MNVWRAIESGEESYILARFIVRAASDFGRTLPSVLRDMGTHKPPVLSDGQVAELARTSAFPFDELRSFFRRSDSEF